MHSIQADMQELRTQLEKGSIQRAYAALLAYIQGLRTRFVNQYGEQAVSGLYQGYMDMTYFAIFPPALKRCDLKVAVVFNYAPFRFEAWLAARNRKVQRQYYELLKGSQWPHYRLVAPAGGVDAILEYDLPPEADFRDPDALALQIETATAVFIEDMERFVDQRGT